MASTAQWVDGARPRTLPLSIAPVLAGTGAAAAAGGLVWWKALLCLGVSVALQVGVNYANDYSDGVRGTDDHRVGPARLVGSGAAAPRAVRAAAFAALGVAAVLGLVLALTSAWWLLVVGAAAIAAAWFYTGGSRPYGYAGLGELGVFVFFGLVAVLGTTFVQAGRLTWASLVAAVGTGALACAVLVANNLRDIPTDVAAGKRTLATRIGDRASRASFVAMAATAMVLSFGSIAFVGGWVALTVPGLAMLVRPVRTVTEGAAGPALVPVLRDTGLSALVWAAGLGAALTLA